MQEITSTRNNHLIDPVFNAWGWEIPVYLFLGGMVAGMMIISGYFIYKGRSGEKNCSCHYLPIISLILLTLGMFALFLDLEHKKYFWRLYMTFKIASPMSWGSWILLFVYPALFLNFILGLPEKIRMKYSFLNNVYEKLSFSKSFVKLISFSNITLGVALGIYTGILLSALAARPLWNSPILGILFLVSGLSSAAAFVHLIARDINERELLARADNNFLSIEIIIFILYFIGMLSSTRAHINAADILLTGSYAAVFWVFVMGMGIIIPLIIQSLAVRHKIQHNPAAPIMVIFGGFFLRYVIVFAGQFSSYDVAALLNKF